MMRGSRWIVLAVILAIVAVFVAQEAMKGRRANRAAVATATSGGSASAAEPLPATELAAAVSSGRPTMADFGKGWCKPCQAMVSVLAQAAHDYQGKANIVYVDMEAYPAIAAAYRINVMPTQIFFDAAGKEVARHIGYMPNEDIDRELAKAGVK
jgi:thioredoxin 1